MSSDERPMDALRRTAETFGHLAAEMADVIEDAVEDAVQDVVGEDQPKSAQVSGRTPVGSATQPHDAYPWTATHQGPERPVEPQPRHTDEGGHDNDPSRCGKACGCTCRCCRRGSGASCCGCPDASACGCQGLGDGNDGRQGGDDGGGRTGRPTRTPGKSRNDLDGSPVTPGDIAGHHPKDSWPGVRKDMPLPFLFFRANAGDTGTRPTVGPFWESPDVYLLAGVHPKDAPPIPAQLGETALAHQPNTVYAHVWNFGRAAAHDIVVEFYWCDPTLGFNPNRAHLIGRATAHLGARGSGHAHHVVKCNDPWVPTFVNGGHECLMVRAWDNVGDLLTTPEWDAVTNRHLAQRNVHVIPAADMPSLEHSVQISVGPLFGEPATIRVQREHPANMPWLQLHTGVRGKFPAPAPATGTVGLSLGGSGPADSHQVHGDAAQVTLHATDDPPAPGTAHIYRVTGTQAGATFGGYTVVVMG